MNEQHDIEKVIDNFITAGKIQTEAVENQARWHTRAQQGGRRDEVERNLASALRRLAEEHAHLQERQKCLRNTEPKKKEGHGSRMGFVGALFVLMLALGLIGLLWLENGSAAATLLGIGAFNVTTMEAARLILVSPIIAGLALVAVWKALPYGLRRAALPVACAALVAVALMWGVCFAREAGVYAASASQTISLSDDSSSERGAIDPAANSWSSWLMLFCMTTTTLLTTFLGKVGLGAVLDQFESWVTNPDFTRELQNVRLHELEIHALEKEIAGLLGVQASLLAEENREAGRWVAEYLAKKAISAGVTTIALLAVLVTGCMEGGGPGAAAGNRLSGKLDQWASQSAKAAGPVMRVIAISPLLPAADKATVRKELETEILWIAEQAPQGSVTVIIDGLNCAPVAKLEAVPGVARIRKKALIKPALAIGQFLDKPHPRLKDDGRVHLPRLAQTLKQLGLPAGTHVVVLANPLFLDDGKDKFFSMADGRVPSDGCLFEDPQFNLYSVVGRQKALLGLYVHLGWPNDAAFQDDSMRQALLRWWAIYLEEQSAVLVTAQPSFAAALEAAREGVTEPLMYADADADAEPAMVKIVKVEREEEHTEIRPKVSDAALRRAEEQRRAKEEAAAKEAEAAAKREREAKEAQRRAEEENESAKARQTASQEARDKYGNLLGSKHDLIVDGQMKGDKILIAAFGQDDEVDMSPLRGALVKKGFAVERLGPRMPDLTSFEAKLDDSRQLWLWSSSEVGLFSKQHVQAIVQRWRRGKLALCLLADNTPFTAEASAVLAAISPGSTIAGDYGGAQVLRARGRSGGGFDAKSPLFHNVSALFEGRTISAVAGPGLVPVCYASNGAPLIATLQQPGSSRLVVFGGYTSMFKIFWQETGISRFAVNCAGWLGEADGDADKVPGVEHSR